MSNRFEVTKTKCHHVGRYVSRESLLQNNFALREISTLRGEWHPPGEGDKREPNRVRGRDSAIPHRAEFDANGRNCPHSGND